MNLLPIIHHHFADTMLPQMVDSALASTRHFWRTKYFGATEAEANDPRPFVDVLSDRKALAAKEE
jgi:hypothetical protein